VTNPVEMTWRYAYHAETATVVLVPALNIHPNIIHYVGGRVSAPLCRGWFGDVLTLLSDYGRVIK